MSDLRNRLTDMRMRLHKAGCAEDCRDIRLDLREIVEELDPLSRVNESPRSVLTELIERVEEFERSESGSWRADNAMVFMLQAKNDAKVVLREVLS